MNAATDFARVQLASGALDVLHAIHFAERFSPHFHETFAIGVVESGLTRLTTPRGEWFGGPGTILAFSPGEIHSAVPGDAAGYTYRMVYPTAEFMREIGADEQRLERGAPLFRQPVIQDHLLAQEFHAAHVPLMHGESARRVEAQMVASLRALVQRYSAGVERGAPTLREADTRLVATAQEFLHQHFGERISLQSVADACGTDEFRLIRAFRRVVGIPPFAYLAQFRVNRAQHMLRDAGSLSDVAYACGFSDQSHMTRAFKRTVGVPPGQYAKSVRSRCLRGTKP